MPSLFDDRADIRRLQEGASAFQQNNPHFNQLLDVASGLMFNTGAGGLHPADRRGLAMVMATLQNSAPGMGTPVADFVAMNRSLVTGALPVTTVGTDGSRSVSNSYGTGNVSVAATAGIMRTFEESMRTKAGAVDIGQTMGLSHNLRSNLLSHLVEQRGVKQGDIVAYDLGKANNAAELGDRIAQMRKDNVEDSSLRSLEKVQEAMKFLQDKLDTEDLKSKDDASLFKNLEGNFDESVIRQTIAQIKGKNTNFQTQTKQLNQELKEAYKNVAENVKELSNLFQTEDLDQLKNYAKGAGIGNFLDKNKAHEVRAQMRDIAVTAAVSGRSAQEVAAERIQIATGMSAMYGGRAVTGDIIDVVQQAGIAGAKSKDEGVFTREAAQAAAARSVANMQNVYSGAIVTTGLFKEQEKIGGVTEEMRAEYMAMDAAHREAVASGDSQRAQLISMQMESWSRKHFGDEAVDSPEFRAFANANYSGEFQRRHAEVVKKANVRTHINNVAEEYGLDEAGKANMERIGTSLIDLFGNNQSERDKFFKMVNANTPEKTAEAVAMLKTSGMSDEEASKFVQNIQSVGGSTVSAIWNPLLTNSRFMQQMGPGAVGKQDRNVALVSNLLSGEQINATSMDAINGFISGMLGENGITVESAADATIANALHAAQVGGKDKSKAEQDAIFQRELGAKGIEAFSIGKADDKTGKFTLEDPAQRKRIMELLHVSDEELTKLLNDPEEYVKRLEGAGINISSRNKDVNGGLLGYTRASASKVRDKVASGINQDEVRSMRQVFGDEAVSVQLNDKGEYEAKVTLANGETVGVSEAAAALGKSDDLKTLNDLAAAGNKEAATVLSDKLKGTITGLNDDQRKNLANSGNAVVALADKPGQVSAAMFQRAVKSTYGTENVEIFNNKNLDAWVDEGLARRELQDDGTYKYMLTRSINEFGLTEGNEITEDDISELSENKDAMGRVKAVSESMGKLLAGEAEKPVNRDQMQKVIEMLEKIDKTVRDK